MLPRPRCKIKTCILIALLGGAECRRIQTGTTHPTSESRSDVLTLKDAVTILGMLPPSEAFNLGRSHQFVDKRHFALAAKSVGKRLAPVLAQEPPADSSEPSRVSAITDTSAKSDEEEAERLDAVKKSLEEAVADSNEPLDQDVEDIANSLAEECEIEEPVAECEERVSLFRRLIGRAVGKKSGDVEETQGDAMEQGWESQGQKKAWKRNVEVWRFLGSAGVKVLGARKTTGTAEDVSAAKTKAAEFIRDGIYRLGPTFVKFGQVISTRTDVLDKEYIEVLKDLQDNVPGFGGERAVAIIEKEFGKPIGEIFDSFDKEPLASASLGQVHRAVYKGKKVAVKVQRAGLKDLFDIDLKNLKGLAALLDKVDPKSDGADRSYVEIYDESAKLLYEEIDYTLEAANAVRFKKSFEEIGINYIRVPKCYNEVTTPRVLTMEYIDAIKMTDLDTVSKVGLDKEQLAQRIADAFLAQILKTSYFHCDPHPGNLQCDEAGNLVYFDMGMMNQLKPNVAAGFKEACFAIFGGGPFIDEIQLDTNGKRLVAAIEQAGVLSPGADRLAVEKLARYFIKAFKAVQKGDSAPSIKQTIGADLQTLTDNNVFRFPSTFTFIFRALTSIEGIGKGLAPDKWDIGKSAQPFVQSLSEDGEGDPGFLGILSKATGLNTQDIDIALTQPKKVEYLERTMREIEQGNLKIRTRSIENEVALQRIALNQQVTNKLLVGSLFLNLWLGGATAIPKGVWLAGAVVSGLQAAGAGLKIKVFDKKQARFENTAFVEEESK